MAPSMFFVMARPAWTSAYRDLDFLNPSGSGDVSFRGPKSNSLVRSTCPGHPFPPGSRTNEAMKKLGTQAELLYTRRANAGGRAGLLSAHNKRPSRAFKSS